MHSEIYLALSVYITIRNAETIKTPGALNSQPVLGGTEVPSHISCHFKTPGMTKLTIFVSNFSSSTVWGVEDGGHENYPFFPQIVLPFPA